MITMTEIARLTGVSQPTVSRVLNGNTSVDPQIRKKVLDCAKEHDYQPNIIAQSLVGSKTNLLGLIVTDISNPYFAEIIKAVEDEAGKEGYTLILFNSDYKMEKEEKYLELLKRYRVDGVILTPLLLSQDYIERRRKYDLPLVSITLDLKKIDSVFISHKDGGKKIGKHLLSMGYENFVFIGGMNDEKEAGYKESLENGGIDLQNHYRYIETRGDEYIKEQLKEFVSMHHQNGGVGVFSFNDVMAMKVMDTLKEMKVKIPEEVALAGFDNTYFCKYTNPTLTSVAQPVEELGRIAVQMIKKKINKTDSGKCARYQLDTRLVPRNTTVKVKEL